jgi:hypothetical protein
MVSSHAALEARNAGILSDIAADGTRRCEEGSGRSGIRAR